MNSTTVLLVLASTVTHGYWNFLVKRSGGGSTFIGLSKVLEAVVFAPFFLVFSLPAVRAHTNAWPLIVGGAVLSLANYVALAKAYETGDLSIVYPVARGGTLLFLPVLGYLAFGERLSTLGWIALACIVAGIVVIRLPAFDRGAVASFGRMLMDPSIAFALLAALATAGYTVWDKHAVQSLPAFAYFYAYTALVAVAYGTFLRRRHSTAVLRDEWRVHRWPMLQVAVFNTLSYLLILLALRTGTSSYVLALRQLSIAMGVVLGWRLLGEGFALPKRLGVGLLVGGCLLVALAR